MPNPTELSEVRRALLEKYLRGSFPPRVTAAGSIPRRQQGSFAPLSFGQQQLWLLAQLMPDSPVYNECVSVHLPGVLHIAALEASLNEICRRHEAWRTTFPVVDGQPVQMIHPAAPLTLELVDLRHLPEEEREAEARRLAKQQAELPYDLAHGPLLRPLLIRLGDEEHRLYLCLHHIIFDGISIYQVFLPELATLYEAFSQDQPSPLPPLPIQYTDYAAWQRGEEQAFAGQLAYWRQQLKDAPGVLELPTDRPRPPAPTYRGASHHFTLSQTLTEDLKALSRREGVTLYVTLVASFYTLLYRYSGQEDILLGTAVADRKSMDVQQLLGFFLNMLVLREKLSADLPFRELLARVRETVLDAQDHQDVPFEYLVKELQPERNPGLNPLFQTSLTLVPQQSDLPCGWMLTQMEVETDTSKFDLSLKLDERTEGLTGCFEYSTDLFDAATIARMCGHWLRLLEGIVEDAGQSLAHLPLLTDAERHQILIEWNGSRSRYRKDQAIHQLFEAQVERTPDAIAVVCEGAQMTYRELNARANQLAHHLRGLGVGSEDLVGICLERSIEMIVGLLATLKAGGAFVPLDPAYPRDRLAFMLQDGRVAVLLTQQSLLKRLPQHSAHVLCLDADWKAIAQEPSTNLPGTATADNLAYVIYTSGSTGKPKGVLLTYGSLVNHCCAMKKHYELCTDDHVLQFSTFTFDASLEQILPTLIAGARLILRGADVWPTTDFHTKIVDYGLTVINLPTAYWQQLVQEWADGPEQAPVGRVRLMIVGGDRLLPHSLRLWQQTAPRSVRLLNAYGPTETTITATTFEIPAHSEDDRPFERVPIGRPLAHRSVYILDTHGNPVPVGLPGELYIGGELLARGYLNCPELTAERFLPDPFSKKPGARMYKTGDLARYLPDGTIDFVGRCDHQVKIRGFRIEPGEIEKALKQHAGVRETVVVAREDTTGDRRLVAYVVAVPGQSVSGDGLRRFLKQRLPDYMLPSAFVLLDALPLTPTGKVDRRALPEPQASRRTRGEGFVAPKLLIHQQLAQLWEDLLNVRPVGIRDNFFDLGGHSLLAVRMLSQIERICGKKLPPATLFSGATIEHLAQAIQAEEQHVPRAPLVAVQAAGTRRPFFYLHGDWTGGAFYCLNLARDLGPDQPFYALEPYTFAGLRVLPSFEAMVAAHIDAMRSVQPHGPYSLGGFCNGALVAYETARQLRAAGEQVDLLLLIDAGHTPPLARRFYGTIRRIGGLMRLSEDQQVDWFLRLRHLYKHVQVSRAKRAEDFKSLKAIDPQLKAFFPPIELLRLDYVGLFTWVAASYQLAPYAGKVTFFWDSKEIAIREAWRDVLADAIEVHIIPGTHTTCRTEHVHEMARHLMECLNERQERAYAK